MQREGAGGQINDKRYERECIGNQNRAFRYGFICFTQLGREEESGWFGGVFPPFFLFFPGRGARQHRGLCAWWVFWLGVLCTPS